MKCDTRHEGQLVISKSVKRRDLLKAIGLVGSAIALQVPHQLLHAAATLYEGLSTPKVSDQVSRPPYGTT